LILFIKAITEWRGLLVDAVGESSTEMGDCAAIHSGHNELFLCIEQVLAGETHIDAVGRLDAGTLAARTFDLARIRIQGASVYENRSLDDTYKEIDLSSKDAYGDAIAGLYVRLKYVIAVRLCGKTRPSAQTNAVKTLIDAYIGGINRGLSSLMAHEAMRVLHTINQLYGSCKPTPFGSIVAHWRTLTKRVYTFPTSRNFKPRLIVQTMLENVTARSHVATSEFVASIVSLAESIIGGNGIDLSVELDKIERFGKLVVFFCIQLLNNS
jgi:hypothetical protein